MAKLFLIDTNIFIDALRGYVPAIKFLESQDNIIISVMTCAELIHGCKDRKAFQNILDLINEFEILLISEKISERAYQLVQAYFLSNSLDYQDGLIAATCLVNNHTFVTRDIKHFNFIAGLEVFVPYFEF